MITTVTPMIHVPDVAATVRWYQAIGFSVTAANVEDGELDFAIVRLGDGQVMFNAGGQASNEKRREVDLFVEMAEVDTLFDHIRKQAEVVEGPHDTFYGMREFVVRDCNRFWLTFAEPMAGSSSSP